MPRKYRPPELKVKEKVWMDREDVSFHLGEVVDELTEKYSLTPAMRHFFFVRLRFATDKEAALACGLNGKTVKMWKSASDYRARFPDAYNEFFKTFENSIEADMKSLLGKAKTRTEELLDAKKTIQTESGPTEIPDHDARFKGLQALYHWLGRWGPAPKVEVNPAYITITDEFRKMLETKARQLELEQGQVIEGEVIDRG